MNTCSSARALTPVACDCDCACHSYVRMVWAQLQGRRLVVPVSWVNDQLHRTRAGAGRATLDQMLKDMQRDSLWVNGKRVTGADGALSRSTLVVWRTAVCTPADVRERYGCC